MKKKVRFFTGCSGFYNPQWKGTFYPEDLPQRQFLEFYADQLNSLEINTSFYHFPTQERLKNFHDRVPRHFKFSVKAPRLITHMKRFNDCERLMNDFYNACEKGLQKKLGCLLFQLPPGIDYNESKLEQIIQFMQPGFRNVIEFRHKSWWNKTVYELLEGKKIIFCSISHPEHRDKLIINSSIAYVRYHGKPNLFYSNYNAAQLRRLYKNLEKKEKLKEAYIYFNNTAGTAGILNALKLSGIISEAAH